jgi:hypothetical protein
MACVTHQWLRDDDTLNLYGWWPGPNDPPVGIFSTAGLDLAPEGPDTDHAIVNTMVTLLAGFFGGQGSHKRPPKNCPLAYNESRDLDVIIRPQKFDAACRKELRKVMAQELPALDALLKAF